MGTLGSSGASKHEPGARAGCGGGHPGREEACRDGLDGQVVAALLVDRAVIDFVAFLGPSPHQETLVGASKVRFGRRQLDTVAANNYGKRLRGQIIDKCSYSPLSPRPP